jgi:hypothetical protein
MNARPQNWLIDLGAVLIGGYCTLMVWGQYGEQAGLMTGIGIAWVGAMMRWRHR